jgi:DNA invertase Pin-like site-specific DNA recombinase
MRTSELTREALAKKKARGERLGVAGGRNKLGANEAEREIVAAVVRARAAGLSIRAIAAELRAAGMRTRKGGEIQSTQVARILASIVEPKA